MKTLKLVLLVFTMSLLTNKVVAQTEPTVIAVVTKAKWCPTCVKNEDRVASEVFSKIDDTKVTILVNDLSDKDTKVTASETLKKAGLENLKLKATGVITFVNAKTKKEISSISVSKSSEEIATAFAKASMM